MGNYHRFILRSYTTTTCLFSLHLLLLSELLLAPALLLPAAWLRQSSLAAPELTLTKSSLTTRTQETSALWTRPTSTSAPACGDVMKLQIQVNDSGIITDVKFKTFGCGSAIASSSYMTERVKGMSLEEAGKIRNTDIAKELSLPPVKLHCSMLAEDAIKAAIRDFHGKQKAGLATSGTIDVSQSASTGETTASVNTGN